MKKVEGRDAAGLKHNEKREQPTGKQRKKQPERETPLQSKHNTSSRATFPPDSPRPSEGKENHAGLKKERGNGGEGR